MMIRRTLEPQLLRAASRMPAVAVTGPRQSGKTTLCRAVFPDHRYVSLEPLDVRAFAEEDPRGFLREHGGGTVLDEVQRTPSLFSYLQEEVDRDPTPGRFVLTGSQQFGLSAAITQSLAGRIALLHLLPLSLEEIRRFPTPPEDLWTTVWTGGYPRIYDRQLDPGQWIADYVATYVQRDVRQIVRVVDLNTFATFLRLLAGRTSQLENLASLGGDAGVTHPTVRAWLSVLEASFVVFRLPRWHQNLRKRAVKAAKLHFVDSGVVCHLLGIREPAQLRVHPLRGAIFESWAASEILKARHHRGKPVDLYHVREDRGIELDIVAEKADRVIGVEVKSGATVASDFLVPLRDFADRAGADLPHLDTLLRLIHGGADTGLRHGVELVPWTRIQDVEW